MTRDERGTDGDGMDRRRYLGLLASAGIASVAGCGGGDAQPSTPGRTGTPAAGETETPSGDVDDRSNGIERRGIEFERVVNAVEDLGWDPNGERPIDRSIDTDITQGTLVEVPPGTYLVNQNHYIDATSNWGIVGTGESRADVNFTLPAGRSFRWIMARGGRNILVENFTMKQGPKFDRSMGMAFVIDGNLKAFNIEKTGANPRQDSDSGATNGIVVQVLDPKGVAVVDTFVRVGPQDFAHYPGNAITVFTGRPHRGTVYYRNLHIENGGEHGIYASKGTGNVRVENGLFRNNLGDGVRISGEGSWVKDTKVVIDEENQHPRNRGNWHGARGIHMQSGEYGYTGGLIENCEIYVRSTPGTEAALKIRHSQGAATIRDVRIVNDTEYPTVEVDRPADGPQRPAKPWDLLMENVDITGTSEETTAIKMYGRPNSVLRNVSVDLPNGSADGVLLDDCARTVLDGCSISVAGFPLRLNGAANSGSCLATLRATETLRSMNGSINEEVSALAKAVNGGVCLSSDGVESSSLVVVGLRDDRLYGTILGT